MCLNTAGVGKDVRVCGQKVNITCTQMQTWTGTVPSIDRLCPDLGLGEGGRKGRVREKRERWPRRSGGEDHRGSRCGVNCQVVVGGWLFVCSSSVWIRLFAVDEEGSDGLISLTAVAMESGVHCCVLRPPYTRQKSDIWELERETKSATHEQLMPGLIGRSRNQTDGQSE